MTKRFTYCVALVGLMALVAVPAALAQADLEAEADLEARADPDVRANPQALVQEAQPSPDAPVDAQIPDELKGVGVFEKLGTTIPTDLTFYDASGEVVELSTYFDGSRPVILNFVYYNCPMLCSVILESFTKSLREFKWTPGDEFEVLTVSFSSVETSDLASTQRERYLKTLGRPEAADGWHFLTGSEEDIFALSDAVGFKFKWIEETKEYAHAAALIFLDGNGMVTRYIHGLNYPTADLRKALVEASEGRVGTTVDRILMYCFRYDPAANSYVLHATNVMKIGGLLTLLVLGLALIIFWRREKRTWTKNSPPGSQSRSNR